MAPTPSRPRTPASLYLVVGVLAVVGAFALVRWVMRAVFGVGTILVLAALVVFVVSRLSRRRGAR